MGCEYGEGVVPMKGTWLLGATGVLTVVVAVMLMAYAAPGSSAQQRGTTVKPAATSTAWVTARFNRR
jgi:hypothetical protein